MESINLIVEIDESIENMLGLNSLDQVSIKKVTPGRLFVPLVALTSFASFTANNVLGLLLTDIASTFRGSSGPAAVGITGQLSTINSVAEVVFAIAMVVLALRFRHKLLYLVGTGLVVVSAVGNFLAPTLVWMQFFFALEGIGSVFISIMGLTMIGDLLPSEKKAKAVSYIVSATFLGGVVSAPIIYFATGFGGWRYAFLIYALPLSVLSLVLGFFAIPSSSFKQQVAIKGEVYVKALKQVFLNRSAALVLLAQIFVAGPTYGPFVLAYYRVHFSVPTSSTVYIFIGALSAFFIGSIVTGQIVNRVGRKRLTIIGVFMSGFFLMLLFFMPDIRVALTLNMLSTFSGGLTASALLALALDQVPKSRSTMMSLTNVFSKIGWSVAPAFAGLMLVIFSSYQALGIIGAVGGAIAAFIFAFSKENPAGAEMPAEVTLESLSP